MKILALVLAVGLAASPALAVTDTGVQPNADARAAAFERQIARDAKLPRSFTISATFTTVFWNRPDHTAVAPVPEPASWAMMLAGFGLVGGALRRRNGGRAAA